MAMQFNGTTQYLEVPQFEVYGGDPIVFNGPLTIHYWMKSANNPVTGSNTLIWVIQPSAGLVFVNFGHVWDESSGNTNIFFYRANTGVYYNAQFTTPTIGQWVSRGVVRNYAGNVTTLYNDGVAGNTLNALPTSLQAATRFGLGRDPYAKTGFENYAIAEFAAWRAVLSSEEMALLSQGISPLCIRQSALSYYMPLLKNVNVRYEEPARWSQATTGTLGTYVDHPRIWTPKRPIYLLPESNNPSIEIDVSSSATASTSISLPAIDATFTAQATASSDFDSTTIYVSFSEQATGSSTVDTFVPVDVSFAVQANASSSLTYDVLIPVNFIGVPLTAYASSSVSMSVAIDISVSSTAYTSGFYSFDTGSLASGRFPDQSNLKGE